MYYTYTAASPVTNLAPVMVLAVKQTVRVVKYLLLTARMCTAFNADDSHKPPSRRHYIMYTPTTYQRRNVSRNSETVSTFV